MLVVTLNSRKCLAYEIVIVVYSVVCTENLIRVDDVMESPKLAE